MKDIYTEKAKQVLKKAESISSDLKHSYVGTEHILVGLLSIEDCAASIILTNNKVEINKVMEMIEALVSPVNMIAVGEKELYTPRAKHVLKNSEIYAKQTKDKQV